MKQKNLKISTKYKVLTHSNGKLTHVSWLRKHENQLDPLIVSHSTSLYSSSYLHCGLIIEKILYDLIRYFNDRVLISNYLSLY